MKIIGFLLIFLPFSLSLFVTLDHKRQICFFTPAKQGSNLTISYVVSGYNEEQISMTVNEIDFSTNYLLIYL